MNTRWKLAILAIVAMIGGCDKATTLSAAPPQPATSAAATAAPATQPASADRPRLSGRVVDQDGRPMAGCTVTAGTNVLGENFWWAQSRTLKTTTDSDGRYSLQLPFAGVYFAVIAQGQGVSFGSANVLMDGSRQVNLTVNSAGGKGKLTGHLRTEKGEPAAGIALTLIGELGGKYNATTDAQGGFTFANLPDYIGQGVVVADAPDRAVRLEMVPPFDRQPMDLTLVAPGAVHGNIDDAATGSPIAGVKVTLQPGDFMNGLRFTAVTDAKGNWKIDHVPPGECSIALESVDYFDPHLLDKPLALPQCRVGPGRDLAEDFSLEKKADIRGTVVDRAGRPIAGAIASAPVELVGDYREEYRSAITDARGHFDLKTAHVGEQLFLQVGHARFGLDNSIKVPPIKAGESSAELRVVLPGAVRIKGMVRGKDGKPIADVICSPYWMNGAGAGTDADGRYDLGWVSLPPKDQAKLVINAPVPAIPGIIDADVMGVPPDQVPGHRFYLPKQVSFVATVDRTVVVPVSLENDQLLTIRGRITDLAGKPVAKASVFAFAGNPDAGWIDQAFPEPTNTIGEDTAQLLATASADAAGRFVVYVLRSAGESTDHGTRYSIGVASNDTPRKLVSDVIVPASGAEIELPVKIDPKILLKRPGE